MRILLGTVAHNQHIRNIARALHEAEMLAGFWTGGVDVWRTRRSRAAREIASAVWPKLDALLSRRQVPDLPTDLVVPDWRWEGPRLIADRLRNGAMIKDWLWERSELSLASKCATGLLRDDVDGYFGVEHGALEGITAARSLGKPSVVGFLSPHHMTRKRWVDSEYDRFPGLRSRDAQRLLDKARLRDARRDREAFESDVVHCASSFTRESLVAAGVSAEKIMTVPLGCPEVNAPTVDRQSADVVRVLYAGPASVRKGAHLLLDAWRRLGRLRGAELHFFGINELPHVITDACPAGVYFHGPVSSARMQAEYQAASVLVFPTLCDGFGMVLAEALSCGLPVITTPNAGASDLIKEGSNGWVVPAGDVNALAACLDLCASDGERLSAMRPAATATAAQWTWADFRREFRRQLAERLAALGTNAQGSAA